jgi:primosomal protein N'
MTLWQVALCSPPFRTFSYRTPEYLPEQAWNAGQRVMVPVGRSLRLGVILSRASIEEIKSLDLKPKGLKPLGWPLDREPLLTGDVLELIRHLALRQMVQEGQILAIILPKALRSKKIAFALSGDIIQKTLSLGEMLRSTPEDLAALGRAWQDQRLTPAAAWVRAQRLDERVEYELTHDPPWRIRPGAKRQLAVLEYLFAHGRVSGDALCRVISKDALKILKDLLHKGLVRTASAADEASGSQMLEALNRSGPCSERLAEAQGLALTVEQSQALTVLESDLEQGLGCGRQMVRLVHGVTGSGKTLLYLQLARSCLARGRSVLLLAPEVALSAQLWAEVNKEFPDAKRHWYHGYLASGAKLAVFHALKSSSPQIVVGTRSALFLPFTNLGLVILDEEHDASYKQEEGFNYQAKEMAFFRIRRGGLLVLGSATPDIKTNYAALRGEIAGISLRQRISTSPQPTIRLVDMRQESRSEPLSLECREELRQVLERGEQAMFLLNRRGFAPLVSCLDCGRAPQCAQCAVGLTYHKGWERLICHYCGYTAHFPCTCVQCGGSRFLPMGEGTEGLEEYLAGLLLPEQAVVRLDRDSTRRKGSLKDILGSFAQGRAQVMVGTQMLSKGHHFPNVTLVAAVDADLGLNLPDYRATEKTFQLLVQLAGRAGRGERPGRVLIQTSYPDHPCWKHICASDYQGFFVQELERRKKFAYPPFVKLGMIRCSHPQQWEQGQAALDQIGEHLQNQALQRGMRILGPAPAPLGQLKGRKRFHCLLKALQWQDIREVFRSLQRIMPRSSPLRISLDLDPVNML